MSKTIHFEHPLTERCRILLRIEFVFSRVLRHLTTDSGQGGEATVSALIEAANLFSRSDLKSELIKELDKSLTSLKRFSPLPGVDANALKDALLKLENARNLLHELSKPIGATLREDEFFKSIMQRSTIPAGTCSFDIPQYHLWLNQPTVRNQAIQRWFEELKPIHQAVDTLLSFYRDSGTASNEKSENGYFHKRLDSNQKTQLITLVLSGDLNIFPEISGDTHRFSIRFRHLDQKLAITTYEAEIDFTLQISSL